MKHVATLLLITTPSLNFITKKELAIEYISPLLSSKLPNEISFYQHPLPPQCLKLATLIHSLQTN